MVGAQLDSSAVEVAGALLPGPWSARGFIKRVYGGAGQREQIEAIKSASCTLQRCSIYVTPPFSRQLVTAHNTSHFSLG